MARQPPSDFVIEQYRTVSIALATMVRQVTLLPRSFTLGLGCGSFSLSSASAHCQPHRLTRHSHVVTAEPSPYNYLRRYLSVTLPFAKVAEEAEAVVALAEAVVAALAEAVVAVLAVAAETVEGMAGGTPAAMAAETPAAAAPVVVAEPAGPAVLDPAAVVVERAARAARVRPEPQSILQRH
jgi:hypothetical protein